MAIFCPGSRLDLVEVVLIVLIFLAYYLLSDLVNTKVDMRFIVDDALWLPEYVRDRLKSEVRAHRRDALFCKMPCNA